MSLASHINTLTLVVWEALLRWAHYLASTWHYKLTYRFVDEPGARALVASADSSLGNAHDGTSWGGRVLGFVSLGSATTSSGTRSRIAQHRASRQLVSCRALKQGAQHTEVGWRADSRSGSW